MNEKENRSGGRKRKNARTAKATAGARDAMDSENVMNLKSAVLQKKKTTAKRPVKINEKENRSENQKRIKYSRTAKAAAGKSGDAMDVVKAECAKENENLNRKTPTSEKTTKEDESPSDESGESSSDESGESSSDESDEGAATDEEVDKEDKTDKNEAIDNNDETDSVNVMNLKPPTTVNPKKTAAGGRGALDIVKAKYAKKKQGLSTKTPTSVKKAYKDESSSNGSSTTDRALDMDFEADTNEATDYDYGADKIVGVKSDVENTKQKEGAGNEGNKADDQVHFDKNNDYGSISSTLSRIEGKLDDLVRDRSTEKIMFAIIMRLPFNGKDEILQFNIDILDVELFLKFTQYFQYVGGSSNGKIVCNMLHKICTPQLLGLFDWRETSETSFQSLKNVVRLVHEAAKNVCDKYDETKGGEIMKTLLRNDRGAKN